jgi:hypothetical protein
MVAVAFVAVILGCWQVWWMSRLADTYQSRAEMFRSMAAGFSRQAADPRTDPSITASFTRNAADLEEVARIYERAAASPWNPVRFVPPSRK